MSIRSYEDKTPKIDPEAYVDRDAIVIGEVSLGGGTSVWPGAVLRADDDIIEVGEGSAIMDMAFLEAPKGRPLRVGRGCLVSHCARLHGCTVEEGCLIGIGATVLDGAVVGRGSVVAAGSLVTPGTRFGPESVVMGAPAERRRAATSEDAERLRHDLEATRRKSHSYRDRTV